MDQIPQGPGAPYSVLFNDDVSQGLGLPEPFRAIYGEWRIPAPSDRPHTYTNFVISRDGRISFNIPGRQHGGDISRRVRHDTWLMGLLRARADAVLVGASTVRVSPAHSWLPETIFPDDGPAFAALRAAEGRAPVPTLILVTRSGMIPAQGAVLSKLRQPVVIATTAAGAARSRASVPEHAKISYHVSPGEDVDLLALQRWLRAEYGTRTLLSEGGATIYGALLAAGAIHDEFLTVSPIVVGNTLPPDPPRPSLVEGVAFSPDAPPQVDLLAVRRYGSYLFQHSRYRR